MWWFLVAWFILVMLGLALFVRSVYRPEAAATMHPPDSCTRADSS